MTFSLTNNRRIKSDENKFENTITSGIDITKKPKNTGFVLAPSVNKNKLPVKLKRDALFGTGLTTKKAQQVARQTEKQQTTESHISAEKTTATDLNINLPDTLVDDTITLDDSQVAALDGFLTNRFAIMIGSAGTGKTMMLNYFIQAIIKIPNPPTIKIVVYTGRGVQQVRRALPVIFHDHCDTIHGFLEYAPEFIDKIDAEGMPYTVRQFIPHRDSSNPLIQDIIIVDEVGMLSIDLWHKLLDAYKEGARVYFVGDINQLPPVHGRSVLGFAMKKWPTYTLNRIHRTEENSIIDGAWNILKGKTPQSVDGKVLLKRISDNSIEAFKQTIGVIQKLSENNSFNPLTDGIITAQNEDTLGQKTFNERLCAYFNQPKYKDNNKENKILNPRTMVTSGNSHHAWAVGDKIMATQNDRDEGITNGMMGIIESIIPNAKFQGDSIDDMAAKLLQSNFTLDFNDLEESLPTLDSDAPKEEQERQSSHVVTVRFQNLDQPVTFSTSGTVNTLAHAYAFTCHKSQGGEYPVVVIICHSANFRMLCREWLYTAWTRAQEKVILLYNSRGLQMALNNQRIKGNTIEEKAESFNKLQARNFAGESDITIPQLPEPEEIKNVSDKK